MVFEIYTKKSKIKDFYSLLTLFAPQAAQTHITREGCNVIYIPWVTRRCRVTGDG